MQSVVDGASDFLEREGLQQSKYLHVLAGAVFLQPRFEQAPQLRKTLRQLPVHERRRLVQRACLLFEQRQRVQRIKDDHFPFITAFVSPDHFTAARNDRVPGDRSSSLGW